MSSSDIPRLFESKTAAKPLHTLRVSAGHPMAEAFISNGALDLVAKGQEFVEARLPEGTYLVKFRAGDDVKEQWVNLTQDIDLDAPKSAPRPSPTTDIPIGRLKGFDAFAKDKSLFVLVTDPEGDKVNLGEISIHRVDGRSVLWRTITAGRAAAIGGKADPGAYVLRVSTPGIGTYEMALWVAPEYDTRVHLTRRIASVAKKEGKTPHLGTASISMQKRGGLARNDRRQYLAQLLSAVLTAERPMLPKVDVINEALYVKSDDLMVGLCAAHVLHLHIHSLREQKDRARLERQGTEPRDLMRIAVRNLLEYSGGSPDAGALAVEYGLPAAGVDFGAPPMLAQSAQMIARANSGELVPADSYACRVAPAQTAVRPWLVWRAKASLATSPILQAILGSMPHHQAIPGLAATAGLPRNTLIAAMAAQAKKLAAGPPKKKSKAFKKAAERRQKLVYLRRLKAAKAEKKKTL